MPRIVRHLYGVCASQIVPPTYAPPPNAPEKIIELPAIMGAVAPAGADALEVTLGDVRVRGAPISADQIEALRQKLTGRPIKVSEIFEAAQALEAAFARKGQVLVRVVVPAQRIVDDATMEIHVVDGFIERVDTSGIPASLRQYVDGLLASLAGAQQINMRVPDGIDQGSGGGGRTAVGRAGSRGVRTLMISRYGIRQ